MVENGALTVGARVVHIPTGQAGVVVRVYDDAGRGVLALLVEVGRGAYLRYPMTEWVKRYNWNDADPLAQCVHNQFSWDAILQLQREVDALKAQAAPTPEPSEELAAAARVARRRAEPGQREAVARASKSGIGGHSGCAKRVHGPCDCACRAGRGGREGMMSEQLYKVLDGERRPFHSGNGQWLPAGEWMPPIENIIMCERGYHVCNREQLVVWLGPAIWTVETRGEHAEDDNKQVWSEARLVKRLETWNSRTQRLFACDCAERVLHLFEQERPDDTRPRRAIEVARLFAEGKATNEELVAAADTAKAAAWSADAAAWPAAEAAVKDAARAAAWSAAWSAESAAWCAEWGPARAAAWAMARDAERAWQTERLFWYLEGEGR